MKMQVKGKYALDNKY